MKRILKLSLLSLLVLAFASCSKDPMSQRSEKTGWEYNKPNRGFFNAKTEYQGKLPAGMVYVPVNSYVKGNNADALSMQPNNTKKRVAVSGFFMDMYEVTNMNWREYLQWTSQVYKHFPRRVIKVLPDETVWRSELSYNEPYEQEYFAHVAFSYYPVVGVSWNQAQDYCAWRTDRINELELINNGVILFKPLNVVAEELKRNPKNEKYAVFTTKHARDYIAYAYSSGNPTTTETTETTDEEEYEEEYEYEEEEGDEVEEEAPVQSIYAGVQANRRFSNDGDDAVTAKEWNDAIDGMLYDGTCRLPTEAEWEFAAYGLLPQQNGLYSETKSYPWSGDQVRHFNSDKKEYTPFNANFMRGRGDLVGQAANHTLTVPVRYFQPNAYGLFNMAGNVNEWVQDVYRATLDNTDEVNSFRGNEYLNDSAYAESVLVKYFPTLDSIKKVDRDSMRSLLVNNNKIAFTGGDFRDFKDGDKNSSINDVVLEYDNVTGIEKANMISNTARVYKGGSWKDRAIWLNPGNRRHLEQAKSTNDIGFRCVMSIVGGREFKRY